MFVPLSVIPEKENYLKDEKLLFQYLMDEGTENIEVSTSKGKGSEKISGPNLKLLIDNLFKFEECFKQVVMNNIPKPFLDTLINLVDQETKSLNMDHSESCYFQYIKKT